MADKMNKMNNANIIHWHVFWKKKLPLLVNFKDKIYKNKEELSERTEIE